VREAVPFDSERWRFQAEEHALEEHLGRPTLRLRAGIATVADAVLQDGTVEFDLALTPERGFLGGVWRVRDEESFEWFYVRPHQSGNPDATQYTPVFNGCSGWQLYHGEPFAVAVELPFDEWFRVRIRFRGEAAAIEVAGEPLTTVPLKREPAAGAVGIGVGGPVAGHFSGFAYSTDAGERIVAPPPPEVMPNAIASWSVSEVFAEEALDGGDPREGRTWTRLDAEPGGLVDLARVSRLREDAHTVLARATIVSDREQTRRLDLGFSDRVRVYVDGRPLYDGRDSYGSRDYRFLGSIGWFDAVYLPLAEGPNELVLAVSEDFGFGWGIQARLDSLDGLTLST
jgi:hypothetical protein